MEKVKQICLSDEELLSEIKYYIGNKFYNYAVMIDGAWGSGKTYFVKQTLLPELKKETKTSIYVSLYGVSNIGELSKKIYIEFLLKDKADKINTTLLAGATEAYIKEIDIPDSFNLHLDITKVRGLKANYQWSEEDDEKYGTDAGYYKYEGDWSFDIPVTVDDSQTEVMELNDTNDAGIGLKSVIRTPYELTVNELYKEGSDSDNFMVALDANGNRLPYNESAGNCNIFAIQDRDISTVDIYILDYVQYMDELKGEENYNNNEKKPEGQKWSNLLDKYAKYHKTLHFDKGNSNN